MSKVITIASGKGGTGKTTLATLLAVAVAEKNVVGVVDRDPQQSLARWIERREAKDLFLFKSVADARRANVDYIIVDTPPLLMQTIEGAIRDADIVVVPTKAGTFDFEQLADVVGAIREANKPFGFVLSEATSNWKAVKSATETLAEAAPLLGSIQRRAGVQSALSVGLAGQESSDKSSAAGAREDITAIWENLKTVMSEGNHGT